MKDMREGRGMKTPGWFFMGLMVWAKAAVPTWGGEVREAVERVLGVVPICSQTAAAWAPAKQLRAEGFGDCEWVEAAAQIAEEDVAVCSNGNMVLEMEALRSGTAGSGGNGAERLRELEHRLESAQDRLGRLAGLLGEAGECQDEALRTLELVAQPSPGKSFAHFICVAWVRLTLNSEHPERFSELGQWYLEKQGADSREFTWFCDALWRAYPACRREGNPVGQAIGRYLLSAAEKIREPYFALHFDQCASGQGWSTGRPRQHQPVNWLPGLEEWEGSLQRRRLAERFADDTVLCTRAAAELAADEKDLTDLREIYGAWEEVGEVAPPPDGEKE